MDSGIENPALPGPVIARISAYVPETEMRVRDLLKEVSTEAIPSSFPDKEAYAGYLEESLHLRALRVERRLSDSEMLVRGLEEIFDSGDVEPQEVDLVVMGQEHDVRQKDNLGQFVQHEFGLENAWVFNASGNHCANIDYAVKLADILARSDARLNTILIAGVVKIASPDKRVIGSYGLLGDAAGGMLLKKKSSGLRLVDCKTLSVGALHNVDFEKDFSALLCKYYIKCLTRLLESNASRADSIRHIVIQNANTMLITQCLEIAGLDPSLIFSANLTRYGHLDSMDLVVNLRDLLGANQLANGDRVLTFGTGWSGSFNASLFEWSS